MLSQLPTNCFSVTRNMKPQSPSLFLAAALLAKTPRPTYTSTVQIDFLSSFFCGLAESPRLPTLAHQKIPASSLSWAPGSWGGGKENAQRPLIPPAFLLHPHSSGVLSASTVQYTRTVLIFPLSQCQDTAVSRLARRHTWALCWFRKKES